MTVRLTDAEREALLANDLALNNMHTEWGRQWLWDAVEDILAARLAEQAEQTLTEAADDWCNEGRGVMFNRACDDLTPERRVGKWLRDRAARIALDYIPKDT